MLWPLSTTLVVSLSSDSGIQVLTHSWRLVINYCMNTSSNQPYWYVMKFTHIRGVPFAFLLVTLLNRVRSACCKEAADVGDTSMILTPFWLAVFFSWRDIRFLCMYSAFFSSTVEHTNFNDSADFDVDPSEYCDCLFWMQPGHNHHTAS